MAIGAVIMAAGAGRRMGGRPKSLLLREGEPLLLRQIRLLARAGATDIVVALGHHAPQITMKLEQTHFPEALRVCWVLNPTPDFGPGSSLRCALAALPAELMPILVTVADLPLLEAADIKDVVQAWQMRPAGIELVLPEYAGEPGHPVAMSMLVRQAVMHAESSEGVREWRCKHRQQVITLSASHSHYTTDVDTPADLDQIYHIYGMVLEWPAMTAFQI